MWMDGNGKEYEGQQIGSHLGTYERKWNIQMQNVLEDNAYDFKKGHINVCVHT